MSPVAPGADVLAAFGLAGPAVPLAGGQGRSFAVDGAVLKPSSDPVLDEWTADVVCSVQPSGFRLATPLGEPGRRVVGGWTAWTRVAGEHRLTGAPWPRAVQVAEQLTAALRSVDRPMPELPDTAWRSADRIAWGEESAAWSGPAADTLDRLQALRRPVVSPPQLVHGDLAGNLLWHDRLPPAVIDVTPYRRPGGYCAALVVVDASLWYGAGLDLVDAARGVPELDQMVVRALLFRLATAELFARRETTGQGAGSALLRDLGAARPLVDWLEGRLGVSG